MADETIKTIITTEKVPIKFGLGQLFHPTPAAAKNVFRFVLYASAAIVIVLQVVTEIPEPIKAAISRYLVELVALVHAFSQLFGIDISGITPPITKSNKN